MCCFAKRNVEEIVQGSIHERKSDTKKAEAYKADAIIKAAAGHACGHLLREYVILEYQNERIRMKEWALAPEE